MDSSIALFCLLHPASEEKKERILSLLSSARSYYTDPASKCTTWTYFLPTTSSKHHDLTSKTTNPHLIGGFEVYTEKSALTTQLDSAMFKDFHAKIQSERLYDRDEELVAWYPTRHGYVLRGDDADGKSAGEKDAGGVLLFDESKDTIKVVTTKLVCRPGRRDRVLERVGTHADHVKASEGGCLTYCVLTRPKAPDEILVVQRFENQEQGGSKHHGDLLKTAGDHDTIRSGTEVQEWTELGNAFVGRPADRGKLDLSSKL